MYYSPSFTDSKYVTLKEHNWRRRLEEAYINKPAHLRCIINQGLFLDAPSEASSTMYGWLIMNRHECSIGRLVPTTLSDKAVNE